MGWRTLECIRIVYNTYQLPFKLRSMKEDNLQAGSYLMSFLRKGLSSSLLAFPYVKIPAGYYTIPLLAHIRSPKTVQKG